MPPTIEWDTYVINVPKSDMVLIQASPEIRQLDVNTFRLALKDIEDDDEGMPHPNTHNHSPPVTVAGANLARVVEILSPYTVTFEDGTYRVILVGANNNLLDVANLNNVSIAVTNSAGLQDLNSLQAASYAGNLQVVLDVTNPDGAGTDFPIGTRGLPVNNITDAITIAENRGIREVLVLSNMTVTSGDFSDGYTFVGESPSVLTLTLDAGSNVENCQFRNMTITGTLDNMNTLRNCVVQTINYFNGVVFECALDGDIVLGGGAQAGLFDCWSNIAGGGPGQYPIVGMGGSGQSLVVRNYNGGIGIANCTGIDDVSIDMNSGRVVLEPTVTGGNFTIRGIADLTDNSGGSAVVVDDTVNASVDTAVDLLEADHDLLATPGELVVTRANDVTELGRYDLTDTDGDPFLPTGNKGIGRRERQ